MFKKVIIGNCILIKGNCEEVMKELESNSINAVVSDPPYSDTSRKKSLYRIDSYDTAKEVNEFCIKNAYRETYKIVVAGYEGEHNNLEDYGYIKYSWKSNGGYRNISGSNDNKFKERLWASSSCNKNIENK